MTVINRPWISSFAFPSAPYSAKKLDQVHKLARNFVASLDLGCPSAKHVADPNGTDTEAMDEREKYLLWVKSWKTIYREVSGIIRLHKTFRRTVRFPKMTPRHLEALKAEGVNSSPQSYLGSLSHSQRERLTETAQVLLNARWNYKLASRERRRRIREKLKA